jgi:hypothetical protein
MGKSYVAFLGLIMLLPACKQERSFNEKSPKSPTETQASFSPIPESSACQKGLQAAKADEAKGIIGYYFRGIAIPPIAHRLKEKYGFTIYAMGCASIGSEGEAWTCYNAYMNEVIKKKYKRDVIALEMENNFIEAK